MAAVSIVIRAQSGPTTIQSRSFTPLTFDGKNRHPLAAQGMESSCADEREDIVETGQQVGVVVYEPADIRVMGNGSYREEPALNSL